MATATLPEVQRLTEAFRAAQVRRAAITAALVAAYFARRVGPGDPEQVERWLALMVPLILREHERAAAEASIYGQTVRTLEIGVDDFRWETPDMADLEAAVRTSLVVTGPVYLRKEIRRISGLEVTPAEQRALLAEARGIAARGAAGAAARHVQNGARSTIDRNVLRDTKALGWVRVTDGDPCAFCAMLASRGPVYKDDSFDESDSMFEGPGRYKVHDSCGCGFKPVYRRGEPLLDSAKIYSDIWASSTAGKSGRDAVNAFRKAFEARSR